MRIDISHVAKLSRLYMDEAQKEVFNRRLESMLDLVGNLPAIDEDDNALDTKNPMRLREDVVVPSFDREDILSNAPSAQAGCYVVPKVIE